MEREKTINQKEPYPVKANTPAAWDLVLSDIAERDKIGAKKYGVRLQPCNGRNQLVDAYQEALDLVVYLRCEIYERDLMAARIAELEGAIIKTLENNGHLADGEVCTLIDLKRAVPGWEMDNYDLAL